MPTYRPDVGRAFLPDDYGSLLVRGVTEAAVALRAGVTVLNTQSEHLRIPVVAADPVASWVAEGADIPPSDPDLEEVAVRPAKLAGLTIISRELADDSSPAAAQVIGEALSRDIARKLDGAYFGNVAAPAPAGLGALTGLQAVTGGAYADLDAFVEAQVRVEAESAVVGAWVMAPGTWQALAQLKQASGSNMPLLASDPAAASGRSIFGVPVFTSPAVAADQVYGIDTTRTFVVMREENRVEVDASRYFESDRVAVRGVMRVGFAFPHPAAIARITFTAPV